MSKGRTNKEYSGEYKQMVIEIMRSEGLSYRETMRRFDISAHDAVQKWERIYLEEGVEGLYIERRGRGCGAGGVPKGRKPQLSQQVEKDLISENQRLRAENDYLKNLHALVQERELREKKRR